jgi:hypothetical protein
VVLIGVGAAGLSVTGLDDFAHHASGDEVLGFEVNPLHNVVHLVFGVLGLIAWVRLNTSLFYGVFLAVGYGAASVFGLFAIDENWNFLSLNQEDNWLHLGLAALGALIAVLAIIELRHRARPSLEIDLREHVDLNRPIPHRDLPVR